MCGFLAYDKSLDDFGFFEVSDDFGWHKKLTSEGICLPFGVEI